MLPFVASPNFRKRLQTPLAAADRRRIEWVLALGRAALALCALVAVYLDATEPTFYAKLAYGLLLLYGAHSLVILALLGLRREFSLDFPLILHGVDLLLAALLTSFTQGPNSPFYVLLVFVLVSAAYRWGYWETLATALVAVTLIFIEALLLSAVPEYPQVLEGSYELNRFIIRSAYMLLMGFLLGYLAEAEKQLEAERSAIARLTRLIQDEKTFRRTIQAMFGQLHKIFVPEHILLAARETDSGQAVLWESRGRSGAGDDSPRLTQLKPPEAGLYLFPADADSWHTVRPRRPRSEREADLEYVALDSEGRRLDDAAGLLPPAFHAAHSFSSLLVVAFTLGGEWSGRLFLFNPSVGATKEAELRFLQALIRQTAPVMYSVYLLRRLRSRIGALERARVARHLHDGAVQSLISIELQLNTLRRHSGQAPGLAEDLARIQNLLHQEILNLRELMEQMKPLDLTSKELPSFLADVVDKFRRETGIAASLVCEVQEVSLPSRVCREIVQIVQEALVNVRRHSGARHALVRFAPHDGMWKLVIEDDGRGFDFQGRLDRANLESCHKIPRVIRERVQSIRGELAIESSAGGAHVEVLIPQHADA